MTGVKYASVQENLDRIRIDVHESCGMLTEIRTVRPDTFPGNTGARFLIRVPRKTALDRIVSSNGAIRVGNTTGGVDAQNVERRHRDRCQCRVNSGSELPNGRIRASGATAPYARSLRPMVRVTLGFTDAAKPVLSGSVRATARSM